MSHYDILGVSINATEEEITKAYGTESFYPNKIQVSETRDIANKREAEKYIEKLNEAYSTLIDPVKRKEYDSTLDQSTLPNTSFERIFPAYSESKFKSRRECIRSISESRHYDIQGNIQQQKSVVRFALEPLYQSLGAFKKLVDSLNEKAKNRSNYQPLALEIQKLYDSIFSKIDSLKPHLKSFKIGNEKVSMVEGKAFIEVLLACRKEIQTAQQQHGELMKTHRGFWRTTPVFKEISTVLDVLVNALLNAEIFIFNRINKHKSNYFGLFQPPKTKTVQEIEDVAEDIEAQISFTNKRLPGLKSD